MGVELNIEDGYAKACYLLGDALTRLALTEDHMPQSAADFYEPKHARVDSPIDFDAIFQRGTIHNG